MACLAGGRARDPLAGSVRGSHPAVQRLGDLERHERAVLELSVEPPVIEIGGLLGQQPVTHRNPVIREERASPAGGFRAVMNGENNAVDSRVKDRARAGAGPPHVVARFQGDHHGHMGKVCACFFGLAQGVRLGVECACAAVMTGV